jgi:Trk K+ transport system NAD-binding subunit
LSLSRLGHEVLAIDRREELVQRWSNELTHVVQADTTDPLASAGWASISSSMPLSPLARMWRRAC